MPRYDNSLRACWEARVFEVHWRGTDLGLLLLHSNNVIVCQHRTLFSQIYPDIKDNLSLTTHISCKLTHILQTHCYSLPLIRLSNIFPILLSRFRMYTSPNWTPTSISSPSSTRNQLDIDLPNWQNLRTSSVSIAPAWLNSSLGVHSTETTILSYFREFTLILNCYR